MGKAENKANLSQLKLQLAELGNKKYITENQKINSLFIPILLHVLVQTLICKHLSVSIKSIKAKMLIKIQNNIKVLI